MLRYAKGLDLSDFGDGVTDIFLSYNREDQPRAKLFAEAFEGKDDWPLTRALEVVLTARRDCGRSAGALARWQAAHGLTADGVAGPLTLGAMGLA